MNIDLTQISCHCGCCPSSSSSTSPSCLDDQEKIVVSEEPESAAVVIRFPAKSSMICSALENSSSNQETGDVFNELRSFNQLCDVRIQCDDLVEISAHKAVLSG